MALNFTHRIPVHFHAIVAILALAACGQGNPASDAATDVPPRDTGLEAAAFCNADRDCDDGLFCDGAELCAPGDPAADARGCVAPSQTACRATQSCNEASRRCVSDCSVNADADGDGHRALECGGDDCDDADVNRAPGRVEVCDARGHDEDCDTSTFGARDADGDGVVDALCCNTDNAGASHCGGDCNDADPLTNPAAHERCNGLDDNCNGMTDEGLGRAFYHDGDGDGFGSGAAVQACGAPAGSVANNGDCDDANPASHPGAPEICDGADNDCDGMTDEGVSATYHRDADGDGFGSSLPADAMTACTQPVGYVTSANDCDDADVGRNPGAPEVCDLVADNDCNPATHPYDMDNDGHDRASCGGDDCDDSHAAAHPGATEICDGLDDDCNGLFDGPSEDQDEDGFANSACGGNDCMDQNPEGGPDSPEYCDGLDDNCNGLTDESTTANPLCTASGGATARCDSTAARCVIAQCPAGRLDCNNDVSDSCESDPNTDPNNCGGCGRSCGAAGTCRAGRCDVIVSVGVGAGYQCVLRSGGGVACRGQNGSGTLGASTAVPFSDVGLAVTGLTDAVQLSVGATHACAVRADGTVVCWGAGSRGELGFGAPIATSPTPVTVFRLSSVASVSAGALHTCALRTDGGVFCWGDNGGYQLGTGSTVAQSDSPLAVRNLSGIRAVVASEAQSYAVTIGNQVYGWGNNDDFQIGGFEMGNFSIPAIIDVRANGSSAEVLDAASAGRFACFRSTDAQPLCLGYNGSGQLGEDSNTVLRTPVANVAGHGMNVAQIATGVAFACTRSAGGAVECWGANDVGQLGDNTTMGRFTAVPVTGVSDAAFLAAGAQAACVVRVNGRVACWGDTGSTPVLVPTDVVF